MRAHTHTHTHTCAQAAQQALATLQEKRQATPWLLWALRGMSTAVQELRMLLAGSSSVDAMGVVMAAAGLRDRTSTPRFITPPPNPRIIPGNALAQFKLHHLEACPDALRAILQRDGFLHFQHDLSIPGAVRAAAEALARNRHSVGIFTFTTGNGCVGDGLRRQTPVSAGAPCLRAFAEAVGIRVGLIATRLQLGAGRPLTVQPPMVLNNCQSVGEPGLVAGVQDLHRDYGGRAVAFNAVVPLEDTTLLVVQGSHHDDGPPPLLPEVCRLPLPRGSLFFFDGFLVHAGDQGVHGQQHPRLHFYVQGEGVRDEVHFVTPEEMLPRTFVVE